MDRLPQPLVLHVHCLSQKDDWNLVGSDKDKERQISKRKNKPQLNTNTYVEAVLIIERFSFECHKTKTKTKTKVITLANHKEHRQYSEPIKLEVITCS